MTRRLFDWRRTPGLPSFTCAIFLFLYAPLVVLVVYSFNASDAVTVWGGFSVSWFLVVLKDSNIISSLENSVIIALASTMLSATAAVFGALGLRQAAYTRAQRRRELMVLGLVILPLVVPEIIVAIATLVFFSLIGIRLGLLNLILAHTVFCIPFVLLPVLARARGLNVAVEDAARDLYADEWRVFRSVTLPLLTPAIISGAMLAFVSSLDDFLISQIVGGAGQTTLPVYIYGMMRLGITPEVNAVSTLLLSVSMIFVLISVMISRHGERTR